MSIKFVEIPLAQVASNPLNPRKEFKGPKFDELVASIRQKGVIEPIIVRPMKQYPFPYQIVAGERRFRAAGIVKLEAIPALVRELTDDEAYDFMLIENLQREDLTDLEEAESFKAYADRHGEDAVRDIAEKTGIDRRYIQSRISVLSLPAKVLEAWKKGELKYGHLEQLLRVQSPDRLKEFISRIKGHGLSINDLKKQIGQEQIPLNVALFDTKVCGPCHSNSAVQEDLFGVGSGREACMSPKCFKATQGNWLKEHWLETPEAKKYGTRGARFDEDVRWDKKEVFYGGATTPKKCLECDNFVSLVTPAGKVANAYQDARVCVGDKSCFNAAKKAAAGQARGEGTKKPAGSGPRVAWHGEYFRNLFFRKRVPAILEGLKPEDPKIKTLLVMCLAHANWEAKQAVCRALGQKDTANRYADESGAPFKKLLSLPYAKIAPIFRAVVQAVFLEGLNVGEYNGFGSTRRRLVAEFLGVNLAKEWAPTEEYFQKKTTREILAFGKKSGLFAEPKVKEYLAKNLKRKPGSFDKLKKSELVEVFLKSGVALTGKVPDEILKNATEARG